MFKPLSHLVSSNPFPLIAPLATSIGIQLTGTNMDDNLSNPDIQVKSISALVERFPDLDIVFPIMDTTVEAKAAGCPFGFKGGTSTVVEHVYKTVTDIKQIPIPAPLENEYMSLNINVVKQLSPITEKPVAAYIVGPVTLAAHFMGINDLVVLAFKDKSAFQAVLNLCNRFILPYGKALVNAGAFSIMVLEPQVVIFSPSIYKTMIQTYLEDLIRDFPNPVLHVCGNTTKLLPHFAQMNHLSALSLDALVDFKTSLDNHEQLRDKVLIGNIDPVNVMFRGSPKIVQDKVTELLNMMIGQNFILSTGCDMVPDTPVGNLDSLINAALKYR